jgi:uncharacterized protein
LAGRLRSQSKSNWNANDCEDAVNRSAHFSAPWRLALCIFAFTSCVAPKVVEYKSFHNKAFAPRKQTAELQEKSTSELLAGGYLLIGYMDLRHNIRTCYTDGTCVQHSAAPPARTDLLQEAAHRGGDIVTILDERSLREPNNKSECTGYYSHSTTVNGKTVTTTSCMSYKTTPGTLEAKVSRALVWRYDPEAAGSDANANAIEQALLTLENVAGKRAAAGSGAATLAPDAKSGGATAVRGRNATAQAREDLNRRIFAAIRFNDRETLQTLTREGQLKNWSDEGGRTAMMLSLSVDQLDSAKTLAGLDAELGRSDHSGKSALVYAAMYGDRLLVEQLCKAGHDPKVKGPSGTPLLFYAIANPDTAVFDYLLAQGLDVHERDDQNYTALMVAAEFGRIGLLTRLLKQGFAVEQRNSDGVTALMSAARGEQFEAAQILLKASANPRAIDNSNRTTLHYAAYGNNQDILRLMLAKGVALNAEDKSGRTALIAAIGSDKWTSAEFLMDRGALLATTKVGAATIGMKLVEKNQTNILRRYVAAYPALRKQIVEDPEWLHLAAKSSGAASINYLLDLGANINAPTKTSISPLMTAATAGNADTVKALLERKADSSLRNSRSRTALQVATQQGSDKVVAAMREFGVRE